MNVWSFGVNVELFWKIVDYLIVVFPESAMIANLLKAVVIERAVDGVLREGE